MTVPTLHDVLLHCAGWAPDALIAVAREQLARGQDDEVRAMLRYAASIGWVPFDPDAGLDPVRVGPPVVFRPERSAFSSTMDGDEEVEAREPDELDRAAANAVELESEGTARALWRAWRRPDASVAWPEPKRVFLVEARGGAPTPALLAGRLQEVLGYAGEAVAQIEVFAEAGLLPPYQRAALAQARLLWMSGDPAPPRIAAIFDPGGPSGFGDREPLPEAERAIVLAFLAGGAAVLTAEERMVDVVDGAPAAVPMGLRTDGAWVWSEATAYYLGAHGIAPPAEFLSHIRATGYRAEPPGTVGMALALAAVRDSARGALW